MKRCGWIWILTILLFPVIAQAAEQNANLNPPCGNSISQLAPGEFQAVKQFMSVLQASIAAKNPRRVAALLHFPVVIGSAQGNYKVRNKSTFLRKYDEILPLASRELLLSQKAECVNVMADGYMIGRGTVWFNSFGPGGLRITTINPVVPALQK